MTSQVEIGNVALGHLKQPPIVSWDDGSLAARTLNTIWATSRDAVLREHPWSCAKARVELAAAATAPVFGATYQYRRMADDLRVLLLDVDADCKWRVEGRYIATNAAPPLKVLYIQRVVDTNQFDAMFIQALAFFLAEGLAMPITNKPALAARMAAQYDKFLTKARTLNGQEGSKEAFSADIWVGSRVAGIQDPYGQDTGWV